MISRISFFQILLVFFTFFLIRFLPLTEINIVRCMKTVNDFALVCNFFTSKHYLSGCRSRWENLDRGQYPFQPIKFVNLVVPSLCEAEPYNKASYKEPLGQSDRWKLFVQTNEENNEFCSPTDLNVPREEVEGNSEIRGKQNSLSPKRPVIK